MISTALLSLMHIFYGFDAVLTYFQRSTNCVLMKDLSCISLSYLALWLVTV